VKVILPPESTRRVRPAHPTVTARQHNGYILLPVVMLITLISVVAFLLNHQSALGTGTTGSLTEAQQAEQVVRAGLSHAQWWTQTNGCLGDQTMTTVPFGASGTHNYTATVTAPGGTNTTHALSVDQDAWFRSDNITTNNGTTATYHLRMESGNLEYAVVRFDLSTLPAGAQIQSATSRFYVKATKGHPEGAVKVHRVTADWTETGATWETMSSNFDSTLLNMIPPQADVGDNWVQVNLTTQVQAWVNGEPNYGIMLVPTGEGTHAEYISREGAASQQPQLDVVVGTGPASPVTITATGTLDTGVTRTVTASAVPAHQPTSTLFLQPDPTEGKDAWLSGDKPSWNYGNFGFLRARGGGGGHWQSPIQFELHGLPRGARVLTATLELYRLTTSQDFPGPIALHAITQSWEEGNSSGGTNPGATWDLRDTGLPWNTPGGDFDATPAATAEMDAGTDTWFSWDLTSLVQDWADGTRKNYGMMLVAGDAVARAEFSSSDDINPALRPKLTVRYACECGVACLAPQGSGTIALIGDDSSPDPDDQLKIEIIESWGYQVDFYEDQDSDAINWSNYDLAYVSETVISGDVNANLSNLSIGVVNEEPKLYDDLQIASGDTEHVGSSIDITDNSHYISSIFPLGALSIYEAGMEILTANTPLAGGLQTLGEYSGAASLTALDQGAATTSGTAAGRRVTLPLGQHFAANFTWSQLNNNGHLLVQRAIQWASSVDNNPNSGHWLLDDGAGTLATDSSGRGNDGTLTDGPLWVGGVLGDALDFDGIDDRVLVPDAPSLDITDNITLAAWIRPNKTGTQYVIRKAQFDSTDGYELSLSTTGKVFFRLNQDTNANTYRIDSTTSYPNNGSTWMHIAATYDGSVMRLYLDGVEEATLNAVISIATNDTDLSIGAQVDGSRGIDGVIDDVWLYGQAMSATEIADLAAENPMGPLAHWKLDEIAGTLAVDSEGGHDGTLLNGPTWTTGQDGGALQLDGVNDAVSVPHDDALSLTGTMTFTAWINPDAIGISYNTVLAKDGGGAGSNYYFGTWQDELVFGFFSGGTFREVFTSGLNLKTDTWQHVAASFDNSANRVLLYLGGVAVHKGEMTFSPTAVSADLTIGRSPDGERWNGKLDDIRIYDSVLGEAEIADIANAGGGGGPGIDPPGACNGTFRDEFNAVSFGNNDGTLNWAGDWLEVGESDGPGSNDVRVRDDNGPYQLWLRDNQNGGEGVEREADLSGAAAATLSFEYRRSGLDNTNDYVKLEISSNGAAGPWAELTRFQGSATDSAYQSFSQDISAYISAATRVRLITSATMGNTDTVIFDNVQIQCSP